jgi:hypothetical protein
MAPRLDQGPGLAPGAWGRELLIARPTESSRHAAGKPVNLYPLTRFWELTDAPSGSILSGHREGIMGICEIDLRTLLWGFMILTLPWMISFTIELAAGLLFLLILVITFPLNYLYKTFHGYPLDPGKWEQHERREAEEHRQREEAKALAELEEWTRRLLAEYEADPEMGRLAFQPEARERLAREREARRPLDEKYERLYRELDGWYRGQHVEPLEHVQGRLRD